MTIDESKLRIVVETDKSIESADRLANSMDKLTASMDKSNNEADETTKKGNEMAGMLKGLVTGYSALKFANYVKGVIDYGDALQKTSLRIGITSEALSQLNHAAEISGISASSLENALKFIAKNSAEAAQGTGTAKDAFEQLGISAKKMVDLSPDEQLLIVADAMQDVESSADRTLIAMDIFGRSGAEMNQLMAGGAEGIRELTDEADRLGLTISTDTANASADFNDMLTRMKGKARGASFEMIENLLPALSDMGKAMDAGGEDGKGLNLVFQGIGKTLASVVTSLQMTGEQLGSFGAIIGATVTGQFGLLPDLVEQNNALFGDFATALKDIWFPIEETNDLIEENGEESEEAGRKLKTYTEEQIAAAKASEKLARENAALEKTYQNLVFSLDEGAKKAHEYEQVFIMLEQAQEKLGISSEEAANLLQAYVASQGKETEKALKDALQNVKDARGAMVDSAIETGNILADTLGQQLKDGEADWESFALHAVKQIGKVIAQLVVLRSIEQGAGAIAGGATPNANGNAFAGGNVQAFADGGVVSSPTMFSFNGGRAGVMGEAGAEAILPLKRGANGKLGVEAQGGGGNTYQIDATSVIHANNADQGTVQQIRSLQKTIQKNTEDSILRKIGDGGRLSRATNNRV